MHLIRVSAWFDLPVWTESAAYDSPPLIVFKIMWSRGQENHVRRSVFPIRKPLKPLWYQGFWCGKQDLNHPWMINSKQLKVQKCLFIRRICQYEKISINHRKCQLHSQLHSNYIQKITVSVFPRKTTCISMQRWFFSFFYARLLLCYLP